MLAGRNKIISVKRNNSEYLKFSMNSLFLCLILRKLKTLSFVGLEYQHLWNVCSQLRTACAYGINQMDDSTVTVVPCCKPNLGSHARHSATNRINTDALYTKEWIREKNMNDFDHCSVC
jgi:hypothetical protein